MATETKDKKPTAGNLRALFKNQSWLKTLRKRMGLGGELGPLGEEFGGTGGNEYAPFGPLMGKYLFDGKIPQVKTSASASISLSNYEYRMTRETKSAIYLFGLYHDANAITKINYSITKYDKETSVLTNLATSETFIYPNSYANGTKMISTVSKADQSEGAVWRIVTAGMHSTASPFYVGFLELKVSEDGVVSTSFSETDGIPSSIGQNYSSTAKLAVGKKLVDGSFATIGAVMVGTTFSSTAKEFLLAAKVTTDGAAIGIGKDFLGNKSLAYFAGSLSQMMIVEGDDGLKTVADSNEALTDTATLGVNGDFSEVSIIAENSEPANLDYYLRGDMELVKLWNEKMKSGFVSEGRWDPISAPVITLVNNDTYKDKMEGLEAFPVRKEGEDTLFAQVFSDSSSLKVRTAFVREQGLRIDSSVGYNEAITDGIARFYEATENGLRIFLIPGSNNRKFGRVDITLGGNK